MNSHTGFVKGTPVSTGSGHIRFEVSGDVLNPVLVRLPDNTERVLRPSGVRWYWVTEIYTVFADNGYIRVASDQLLNTANNWLPASELTPGMPLHKLGKVQSVKFERVLAPICRLLFTQPAVILSKGVYLYLPVETANTRENNDFEESADF